MLKQLPLIESVKCLLKSEGEALLSTVREAVRSEVKQSDDFAELVNVKTSQMSAALNGNGYHFGVEWIPAVIYIDKRRRFLTHAAKLGGCKIVEAELSDAEKVRRYEAALRRAGIAGEAIMRDALDGDEP